MKKINLFSLFAIAFVILINSCDNPFSNSMGEKPNIAPPVLTVISPVAGDYIRDIPKKDDYGNVLSYIPARFIGHATDEREVRKLEVKIFKNDLLNQPEIDWTTEGITWTGDKKSKSWTYDLDTLKLNGGKDGQVIMRFRAWDESSASETVDLVYIVKNKPPEIRMTSPAGASVTDYLKSETSNPLPPRVPTGDYIRGQITDRRGLKPGYPLIKIWPVKNSTNTNWSAADDHFHQNAEGEWEPDDDHPLYGYASLFLSSVKSEDGSIVEGPPATDALLADNPGDPNKQGQYVDRSTLAVKTSDQFQFKLAEWEIIENPAGFPAGTRHFKYLTENSSGSIINKPLPSGSDYYFVIKTSDVYADDKQIPREPHALGEEEMVGFFPPYNFGFDTSDDFKAGKPVRISLVSSDEKPTVVLANEDLLIQANWPVTNPPSPPATEEELKDGAILPNPHIYILEPTSKKITTGNPGRKDFRLRILATHPDGIDKAVLRYRHEASGRNGILKWDSASLGYIDNTNDSTRATDGSLGEYKDPTDPVKGKLFTFTAMGGLTDLVTAREIFTNSSDPYILEAEVYAAGIASVVRQNYVLYMDGQGPSVGLRSFNGASTEPSNTNGRMDYDRTYIYDPGTGSWHFDSGADKPNPGGVVVGADQNGNSIPSDMYTVSGNIQVHVSRTDDSGILTATAGNFPMNGNNEFPLVKWIIEEDAANYFNTSDLHDTVYARLKQYKNDPKPENNAFFNTIDLVNSQRDGTAIAAYSRPTPNALAWGVVTPVGAGSPPAGTDSFYVDAARFDGKTVWLYIIAEDRVQNLGFVMQKIKVDTNAGKPKINLPSLDQSKTGFTGAAGLDVTVAADHTLSGNVDGDGVKKNILTKDDRIDLSFTDDDGIDLNNGGVTIKLTEYNGSGGTVAEKTFTAAEIKQILPTGTRIPDPSNVTWSSREWQGALTPALMARIYGQPPYSLPEASLPSNLRDGLYSLTISVTDDASKKVAIPGDPQPVSTSGGTNTYYFAVQSELPKIVIESPRDGSLQSAAAVNITGTVQSRLMVQRAWISFTPDIVSSPPNTDPNSTNTIDLPLYSDSGHSQQVVWGTPNTYPTPNADGYYIYYWIQPNVNFNPYPGASLTYTLEGRRFGIEAVDRFALSASEDSSVQVDTTPPEVNLINFNYGRSGDLNGKVPFTVSASDANGIKVEGANAAIKWWFLPQGSTAPSWVDPFPSGSSGAGGQFSTIDNNNGRYTAVINTTFLNDPARQDFVLYVLAKDNADNENSPVVLASGHINQDADYPVLNIASLNPPDGVVRGSVNLTISGTVSDDDGFNADKLSATPDPAKNKYVQIRFPAVWNASTGVATSWGAWIDVPGSLDPGGQVAFSFKFDDHGGVTDARFSGYFAQDGEKYYQIRVTDEPEAGSNNRPAGKNPDGELSGGSTYLGAVSRIFDNGPNSGSGTGFKFIFDNAPPEIFFDRFDPTTGHPHYSSQRPTFQFVGTALSTNPEGLFHALMQGEIHESNFDKLSFAYGTHSRLLVPVETSPGSGIWKWTIMETDLTGFDSADQGPQSITLEATDTAGNIARVNWMFYKDTQGPEVDFTTITRAVGHSAAPGTPAVSANLPPNSTGPGIPANTAFPTNWPSDWPWGNNWTTDTTWSTWKDTINKWPSDYAFFTGVDLTARADKVIAALKAENERNPTVVSGEKTQVTLKGKFNDNLSDIWTYTGQQQPASGTLVGETFTYRFDTTGAGDTKPWSGPEQLKAGNSTRSAEWEVPNAALGALTDGEHTLDIRVADTAGNKTVVYGVRFVLDTENPEIDKQEDFTVDGNTMLLAERVFSAATATQSDTGVFTIKGTVSDINLSGLVAELSTEGVSGYSKTSTITLPDYPSGGQSANSAGAGETAVSPVVSWSKPSSDPHLKITRRTTAGQEHIWDWEYTVMQRDVYDLRTTTGTNDGTRRFIKLTGSDKAKRKSITETWYFYLDSAKPAIEYNMAEKEIFSPLTTAMSLTGSVQDDTTIKDIKYRITKWDYAANSGAGSWKQWQGGNWNTDAPAATAALAAAWPSLLATNDSGAVIAPANDLRLAANARSTINWTLNKAKTDHDGYPSDMFTAADGQYRLELFVTDRSRGAATVAGNPHLTLDANSGTKDSQKPRIFFVDNADPAIILDPAIKQYYSSTIISSTGFTFQVSDKNTVPASGIRYKVTQPDGNDVVAWNYTLSSINGNNYDIGGGTAWNTTGNRTVIIKPSIPSTSTFGTYTLVVEAADGAGRKSQVTKQFTLDNDPPELKNITPAGGAGNSTPAAGSPVEAVTGRVVISGNTSENSNQIEKVAFAVRKGGTTTATTPPAVSPFDESATGWHHPDGTHNSIKDSSTTIMTFQSGTFKWDILIPNVRNFISTTTGQGLVQQYTVAAATNLTANPPQIVLGALTYRGENIPTGGTVYKMTVYFYAEDLAGNYKTEAKDYWLYPEGDWPTVVSITSPNPDTTVEAERVMNGRIRISGMARDNERIQRVWFRVKDEATGQYFGAGGGSPNTPANTPIVISVWNETTWEPQSTNQSSKTLTDSTNAAFGAGWYMANGGGSANVAWWAYINTEGELNPSGVDGRRKITIEVRAEDDTRNENGDWLAQTGLISGINKKKEVTAFVTAQAPAFEKEEVAPKASASAAAGEWKPSDTAYIMGRGSYRITVKSNSGLQAVRWTPNGSTTSHNLLDEGATYNSTTYGTHITAMNGTGPYNAATNPGIAVKAVPNTTKTLSAGKFYFIWDGGTPLDSTFTTVGKMNKADTGYMPASEVKRNTVFYASANGTLTTGSAIEMTGDKSTTTIQNGDGFFEWTVIVDVNITILRDIDAPTTNYENKSALYPVNLSAVDISRPSPLQSPRTAFLPIDNKAPKARFTGNPRGIGPSYALVGEAGDEGAVRGLSQVVIWFSRRVYDSSNSNPKEVMINYTGLDAPANGGTEYSNGYSSNFNNGGSKTLLNSADGTTTVIMPTIPLDTATTGNSSCIVIDRADPSGTTPHHGHQRPMGFSNGGSMDTIWYAEINSTGLVSGPVTLHYVVYDKAGNTRYYKQHLVIMNDAPKIKQIKFGTDIRRDSALQNAGGPGTTNVSINTGSAESTLSNPLNTIRGGLYTNAAADLSKGITDDISSGVSGTAKQIVTAGGDFFNVRNKLLAFRIETTGAPGAGKTRNFRFEYVSGSTLITDLKQIKRGRMYVINQPGDANWGAVGASSDSPAQGTVFLATDDGLDDNNQPIISWTFTVSAYELNSAYYSGGSRNVPAALALPDATYTTLGDANATSAEFAYKAAAFGTMAGSSIIDYNPALNSGGSFPPPAGVAPQLAHSLFILKVFDGPEDDVFADYALLSLRVNNDDKSRPTAQLYDLNPLTEGQERAQTVQRSLAPMSIGANRTRGGLWNTNTQATDVVKPGHIEPRKTTSLTSAQMGGAASLAASTTGRPYANPLGFMDVDTVSGQVIVRGYAEDDQRIQRIDLLIGGTPVTILEESNPTASAFPGNAGNFEPPFTGLIKVAAGQAGKVFYTDTQDLYRHRVEWAYIWDTEQIPSSSTVVGNTTVRAVTYNMNSAAVDPASTVKASVQTNAPTTGSAGTLNNYNNISINIRPYITGFLRDKSKFYNDTRSRQGWYTFSREEDVAVSGFNLGSSTLTTTITQPGLGTAAATTGPTAAQQTNYGLANINAARYRIFKVDSSAKSTDAADANTAVKVTVNNLPAVNTDRPRLNAAGTAALNTGHPWIQPWNMERTPARDGSDLWDDYTRLHIWQSNNTNTNYDRGYFPKSTDAQIQMFPSMSINPRDGTLWTSFDEEGPGNQGFNYTTSNAGAAVTKRASFIDPIFYADVFFSPGGANNSSAYSTAEVHSVFSIIGRDGTSQSWTGLGGIYIYGPNGVSTGLSSGGSGSSNYLAESTWYNASTSSGTVATPPTTDQFESPHIVTSVNAVDSTSTTYEHIHVSYYDTKDGSIKYRYNRRGAAGTINATGAVRAWTNLDGGFDTDDTTAITASGPWPAVAANGRIVDYTARSAISAANRIDAGKHNAIAVTSDGYPVVAYYDATNMKLKLAVSNSVVPVAADNWKIRDNVIPAANMAAFGTGQYVSIRIDRLAGTDKDRIHIAAFRGSPKSLVYITGMLNPNSSTPDGTLTGVEVQVVDSVGMPGKWSALSLDSQGRPWIAYQDEAYIGSMDGVRMAYRDDVFAKTQLDLYGNNTAGWETINVPARYRVQNDRISIESFPTRNVAPTGGSTKFWSAAVGYLSTDNYRIAYYVHK